MGAPSDLPDFGESTPGGINTGTGTTALTLLATLPVKGKAPKTGYDRTGQFGTAWMDVDRNGCDTRNDILARDLTEIVRSGACKVMSGVLDEPYTGKTISFVRGQDTSSLVQIDHMVALSNAWQTGAQQFSAEQRLSFANDPLNLLAVDGRANSQKGDGDAATWLPAAKGFRCTYVARQIAVKASYGLWVAAAEHDAMVRVLDTCPEQLATAEDVSADTGGDGERGPAQGAPVKAPPAPTVAPDVKPDPAPAPAPANPATPTAPNNVSYKNCAAARAAGAAPVYKGDPGYSSKLDRDGDGIGCE